MATALNWQPKPTLLEKVLLLAQQQGRSPEAILTEAVTQYLETQMREGDRPTSLNLDQRQAFLKLPLHERRHILQEQAESMLAHYQNNAEWRELQSITSPNSLL
jgi:hypothetical protein